jgi:hypothetical protein
LQGSSAMFQVLASLVDFVHALVMVVWIAGLPLLFWRRRPGLTRAYAIFAVSFIVLSQGSHLLTGECFLTTLSRWLWEHGGAAPRAAPEEWFTVRFATAIFHLTPSHRAIKLLGEALILVTAIGMLVSLRSAPRGRVEGH